MQLRLGGGPALFARPEASRLGLLAVVSGFFLRHPLRILYLMNRPKRLKLVPPSFMSGSTLRDRLSEAAKMTVTVRAKMTETVRAKMMVAVKAEMTNRESENDGAVKATPRGCRERAEDYRAGSCIRQLISGWCARELMVGVALWRLGAERQARTVAPPN